jgi:hypothetical protein
MWRFGAGVQAQGENHPQHALPGESQQAEPKSENRQNRPV